MELDIFSGRPNPRWQLDERAARTLRQLHENLLPISGRPPEPPGLGYRGFTYVLDGEAWRAYRGWVVSSDRSLIDRGQTVERLLLEGLPEEHAELRALVAKELA